MSAGQMFQIHNENMNPKNGFVEELDRDEEMRLTDQLSGRLIKFEIFHGRARVVDVENLQCNEGYSQQS